MGKKNATTLAYVKKIHLHCRAFNDCHIESSWTIVAC